MHVFGFLKQWLQQCIFGCSVHDALQRFSKRGSPQHATASDPEAGGSQRSIRSIDAAVSPHQPQPAALSRCQSDMLPSIIPQLTPAGGRLDQDIARMLWRKTQKPISLLRDAIPIVSQHTAPPETGSMQLTEAEGNLLESQGRFENVPGVEGRLPSTDRHPLGFEDIELGHEATTYIEETSSGQQLAPHAASANADPSELRLPDEVLVEQANDWAGRYSSRNICLLL